MLADAFNHCQGAAVAHCEAFTRLSGNVKLARSRTVKHGIAHEHVAAFGSLGSGAYGNGSTAQAFAHVVVGFACQAEVGARDQESPKTLSGRTNEFAINPTQVE